MMQMTKAISVVALAAACFVGSAALAQSANLQRALDHLQTARNDLEANSRKDQHSKQALTAIEHVRKGLDESRKKDQKDARQGERQEEKSLQQEQKDLEKSQQKTQEKSVEPEPKKTKK